MAITKRYGLGTLTEKLAPVVAERGYAVLQSRVGQLLFRRFPVGRALVRRVASLSRKLPLSTPLVVMIDPCNLCNFQCSFCPTSDVRLLKEVGRPRGRMRWDVYEKLIKDLGQFDEPVSVLTLHKDGEPLLNEELPRMVRHAKQARVARCVELTTNASLLTEAVARDLVAAELDVIRISVEHVTDEGYRKITGTFDRYDRIVENVGVIQREKRRARSRMRVVVKTIGDYLCAEEKRKFVKDFSPIADVVRFEGIMGWSSSERKDFALGLKPSSGLDGVSPLKQHRIVCPEPFRMLAVNFDGSVSSCCADWSRGVIVGDATVESLREIWEGEALRRIRHLHLAGRRELLGPCANCHYMLGVTDVFDLDADRQRLMDRYGFPRTGEFETPLEGGGART